MGRHSGEDGTVPAPSIIAMCLVYVCPHLTMFIFSHTGDCVVIRYAKGDSTPISLLEVNQKTCEALSCLGWYLASAQHVVLGMHMLCFGHTCHDRRHFLMVLPQPQLPHHQRVAVFAHVVLGMYM